MTTSFDALKKNRSKSLEKLTDQLSKINSKNFSGEDDSKYWKPTRDSSGNAHAIIRFLPPVEGEDFPFVQLFKHSFQGPGGWYIENSLTTLQKEDPVGKMNTTLWNSTTDDKSPEREQARNQKRKLQYISNIYVIKDDGNPDNDGKVFLFSYGKKIFDKLNDLMNPSFKDETPVNPFDFWEGANFRLKVRTVDKFPNYDKSTFDSPEPLFEDDDKLEAVWKQQHSLKAIIDPKNFKTYEELEAKLMKVLGQQTTAPKKQSAISLDDEDEDIDMSKLSKSEPEPELKQASSNIDEDDDEDMAFFKNLAKG